MTVRRLTGLFCGLMLVLPAATDAQESSDGVGFAYSDDAGQNSTALVGYRPYCRHCAPNCCTCLPQTTAPSAPGAPVAPSPGAESPSDAPYTPEPLPEGSPLAPGQYAAGDVGVFVAAPQGAVAQLAPNMIGDFFGGGAGLSVLPGSRNFPTPQLVAIPSPGVSGVGRVKLCENVSPIPRDRIFFNYSYFDNVPLTNDGVNVNRYIPGFEKTFLDGTMSFEVRFPFASTLDSDIVTGGLTNTSHGEFGNLTAIWKTLLHVDRRWLTTAGLQVTVPTADDVTVSSPAGVPLVQIDNQATHLMPFFGLLWLPSDRWFIQGYYQVDVATNGNRVFVNNFPAGLVDSGKLNDTTFMYADIGLGYWAYQNFDRDARLTGIAPTFEFHWNQSLQHSDVVATQSGYRIGSFTNNVSITNAVFGTTFWFGNNTSLTAGYATPIGGGADQDFDGELRVVFNRFFGAMSPASRVQF